MDRAQDHVRGDGQAGSSEEVLFCTVAVSGGEDDASDAEEKETKHVDVRFTVASVTRSPFVPK